MAVLDADVSVDAAAHIEDRRQAQEAGPGCRDQGAFHEAVTNRILDDLVAE